MSHSHQSHSCIGDKDIRDIVSPSLLASLVDGLDCMKCGGCERHKGEVFMYPTDVDLDGAQVGVAGHVVQQ